MIDYFVEQGYDDEDLVEILGINKGTKFINALLLNNYDMTNNNFLMHFDGFLHKTIESMKLKHVNRIIHIMKEIPYFKDKNIMQRT